ncbi:helix-turn-helix transcriptional regulator [Thalassococcus sp. BH17M4-6]|uniref:helix-turn-helix transcriptional regulator n=1 Tax=Thalassococcus sp. BH17M4-6 TaxID=3413148 RepID=UPI003BE0BC04
MAMNVMTLNNNLETGDFALSQREIECLSWVAIGKSSWDIGQLIGVSENTVNFHMKNIFAKLEVNNRTLAAVKAVKLGLIEITL